MLFRSDVCIRTFSSVRRADPAVGDGEIEVPGSAIRRRVPVAVDRSSLVAKQTDEPLVEVTSGSQSVSRASQSHRLKIAAGTTLRVSAPQYLLNTTIRVTGKPVDYNAPALGNLTVLTRHETCNVKVGDRVVGFPPITRMPVAAGQYRVDIECPNGQNPPGQVVTVAPNQTATARIY